MLKLRHQCFGHLMQRTDSLEKDPDAGKDWRQEEKGTTEDEMVVWHHRLKRHEFEQTLGDSEWQGRLACSISWYCKELNNTVVFNTQKYKIYIQPIYEVFLSKFLSLVLCYLEKASLSSFIQLFALPPHQLPPPLFRELLFIILKNSSCQIRVSLYRGNCDQLFSFFVNNWMWEWPYMIKGESV